ncbi:MAG: VOC family protein [Anaerolineaceae bacterium]|nr:VOC family protein [Anaerolineaceae bacterium]
MTKQTKYVHTCMMVENLNLMVAFYQDVFGCVPVPPARDLSGEWLENSTGVADAQVHGQHLRLPGYGDAGPTLEIFQYRPQDESVAKKINRPGFAHIAFAVADVDAMRDRVIQARGTCVGDMVTVNIADAGMIQFIYVRDPEGNIVELQKWLS